MSVGIIDPMGVLIGLYAVATGLFFIARPQSMFRMRHWLSVTGDSELSELGVLWYRASGVLAILLGLWLLYDWGRLGLLVSLWP
ncbi:hypothetical protein [Haloprofundus salinisoli]|uniref:hypothetical protein n=1 Tax=Haloprofundus salinisoli TaxID=2876193 RepID=UPI001CCF8FA6|nr:hypothetical protein [Haloprofundus salinisoli]